MLTFQNLLPLPGFLRPCSVIEKVTKLFKYRRASILKIALPIIIEFWIANTIGGKNKM